MTSKILLQSILNVTGSQCKDLRTGVICSDFSCNIMLIPQLESASRRDQCAKTLATFKSRLKTHLFSCAFVE